VALVEAAVELGVVRTVDAEPGVDKDPVTLTHDDLDSLINVMLIAVSLRIATTARLNMTN
jgi:hypothetical protein